MNNRPGSRIRPTLSVMILLMFFAPALCTAQVVLKPHGQDAVPLRVKALTADTVIDGQFAATNLTLLFQNETSERIEADFLYTLPPDTLVTAFAYWYGTERVQARIVEKEEAAAIYSHITTRMRDPALVEMVGKSTFRARIFPVMPNSDLKVEMTLVQTLPSRGQNALFTLPLKLKKGEVYDRCDVRVHVNANPAIVRVTNDFGLPVAQSQGRHDLHLVGTHYRPRHDLNVQVIRRPSPLQAALYTTLLAHNDGYFALALTPDRSLTQARVSVRGVDAYNMLPATLGRVGAGQEVTVVGRYRLSGLATVTLTGTASGKSVTMTEQLGFKAGLHAPTFAAKMWAAKWMERLSEQGGNRATVMRLSLRYGMPSKYTSWLAVPKVEMERYEQEIAEAKIETIAGRLGALIVAHRGKTRLAARLHAELNALCSRFHHDPAEALRGYYDNLANQTASNLVDLILNGRANSTAAQKLNAELNAICLETREKPTDVIRASNQQRLWDMGDRLSTLVMQDKGESAEARELKATFHRLTHYAHVSPQEISLYYPSRSLQETLEELGGDIEAAEHGSAIWREHSWYGRPVIQGSSKPDAGKARQLRARLNRLARNAGLSPDDYLSPIEDLWKEYAVEQVRDRLQAERQKSAPDADAVRSLDAEFVRLNTAWKGKAYAEARSRRLLVRSEKERIQRQIDSATPNADPAELAQLRRKQQEFSQEEDQLRARMGDPLISIEAPKDAVQVIALMPGGEVKRLDYNPTTHRWEARFDIPTYAHEGDYIISVVIVLKDGTHQTMQIHYHVDLTPPTGVGKAQIERGQVNMEGQPVLRLQLDAAEDTARVKALLPWGEMVELRPSGQAHRFFALVPVSPEHGRGAPVVQFIITDRAHNRTTVLVDLRNTSTQVLGVQR